VWSVGGMKLAGETKVQTAPFAIVTLRNYFKLQLLLHEKKSNSSPLHK
jgi:hypothetical protein